MWWRQSTVNHHKGYAAHLTPETKEMMTKRNYLRAIFIREQTEESETAYKAVKEKL